MPRWIECLTERTSADYRKQEAGAEAAPSQPKLAIGQVNDPLEREADRAADQATGMKGPELSVAAAPAQISQRLRQECEEEEAKGSGPHTGAVDGRVASEIRALHGGGAPLPKPPRAFFESSFGHDFTAVRIHADSQAAKLARSIDARAFTLGQDIVFGAGEYSPESGEGTRLLAHELAHVVQQQSSPGSIQRQPTGGGKAFPPLPPLSVELVELHKQIAIVGETQIPWEIWRKPESALLSDSDVETILFKRKFEAIIKLGDLRHEGAVPTLIAVLDDGIFAVKRLDPQKKLMLQQEAVEALAKIGGNAALAKLNALLNSKDPKERLMAARGLSAAAGGQAATDLLTALKKETDADIKSQIIHALGQIGGGLASNQEKETIVKELIREMESNTGVVQHAAVNALGAIKLKSATEPLLKQLKLWQSVQTLAVDIIIALGEIGDDKAVEYLVIMLEKHGSKSVRSQAAIALGKIGGAKAVAALKRRLTEETDGSVKAAISKAIP